MGLLSALFRKRTRLQFFFLVHCIEAFLAILLVSSCATLNVPQDDFLNKVKSEGYLLATVRVNRPGWQVTIMPRNTQADYGPFSMAVAVFDKLEVGGNLFLIKLPAGKYTFKYVYKKPFAFEMIDFVVEVASGTINYVGDFEIHVTNNSSFFPAFEYRYVNSFYETTNVLKNKYPRISSAYPIVDNSVDSFGGTYLQPIQRM